MGEKAADHDFTGRFREIVSDPLNLAIQRHPQAGRVEDGCVYLHNGLRVPLTGAGAYYGEFSAILAINRGVHEPLEEFVFQEVMARLPAAPTMLELGAYWGHYSMWLKQVRPLAQVTLVEPDPDNLRAGQQNFALNGFTGEFIQAFVGTGQFGVDGFLGDRPLSILHADIQGYELEMLDGAAHTLARQLVDYVFISTHSQELHRQVVARLRAYGYRVEVVADFECDTTSFDGFTFATRPSLAPVFVNFVPLGRVQIESAPPAQLIDYLTRVLGATTAVV